MDGWDGWMDGWDGMGWAVISVCQSAKSTYGANKSIVIANCEGSFPKISFYDFCSCFAIDSPASAACWAVLWGNQISNNFALNF